MKNKPKLINSLVILAQMKMSGKREFQDPHIISAPISLEQHKPLVLNLPILRTTL